MGIEDLLDEDKVREAQVETPEKSELAEDAIAEKPEIEVAEKAKEVEVEKPNLENPVLELNDETVRNYIKSQREKDENSFSDYFKSETKEVEKVVNPYAELMDDYDKNYFEFKKETGLGRSEFEFTQKDTSEVSPLEYARQRVREESGKSDATNEAVDQYLEKKLEIDLSDELTETDSFELMAFAKPQIEKIKTLQEKYKTTIAEKPAIAEKVEMVKLESGEEMPKEKYEQLVKQREEYINNLKEGVSSATSFDIDISFGNKGEEQTAKFGYEYSEEDKHSMLSNASDVNSFISNKFRTEKGFDFKGLATFIDRAENFNKYIALAYEQARAETLESKIASDNNENFTRTPSKQGKSKSAKSILDLVPQN